MQQLFFEFFPVVLFFIAYHIWGIYAATAVGMATTVIQVIYLKKKRHQVPAMLWVNLVLITIFGSATIYFHNPLFIKWKISLVNWLFGLAFLLSNYFGKQPLMQRLFASGPTALPLPDVLWRKLNLMWAGYFIVIGFINLYVIYHFSTSAWVDFKLFGIFIITFIFAIAQSIYLHKALARYKQQGHN